ncbi:cytidylate kinase [Selenomonas sp. oral taxon 126]|uniref:(d)CMP kinase n=1 Tax=Selenomonas sp. oral taxon 126 TaxID=712528 RepID=UPI00080797DA|nr:(d)CMP kinase [Selenomonas sp. oral taxon 126]ANR71317.1 cytidylate kinase [Selenomonas sp. oral taxon 126]
MKRVIAIDGPAGAGKSTVAKIVAEKLGYTYIDTGAMYRGVAWKTLRDDKDAPDEAILRAVHDIDVRLACTESGTRVTVDGTDVTAEIRTPEVTHIVSRVAALGPVREKMVELQRAMAADSAVVMDGRDIGTNVLPNADVKIFLTASVEERARRRYDEMVAKGYAVNFDALKDEIASRDKQDSERAISPLRQAEDAVLLDSTALTIDEVVARILELSE